MNVKYYDLYIKDAVATALAPFGKDYVVVDASPWHGTIQVRAQRTVGKLMVLIYIRQSDGKLLFSCSDEAPL